MPAASKSLEAAGSAVEQAEQTKAAVVSRAILEITNDQGQRYHAAVDALLDMAANVRALALVANEHDPRSLLDVTEFPLTGPSFNLPAMRTNPSEFQPGFSRVVRDDRVAGYATSWRNAIATIADGATPC